MLETLDDDANLRGLLQEEQVRACRLEIFKIFLASLFFVAMLGIWLSAWGYAAISTYLEYGNTDGDVLFYGFMSLLSWVPFAWVVYKSIQLVQDFYTQKVYVFKNKVERKYLLDDLYCLDFEFAMYNKKDKFVSEKEYRAVQQGSDVRVVMAYYSKIIFAVEPF